MTHRIAVSSKIPDARAGSYLRQLRTLFPLSGLKAAFVVQVYTVDAELSPQDIEKAAEALANPQIEDFSIGHIPTPAQYTFAIEIGFLPGVTDNVGRTARETIEDRTGKKFKDGESVYSSFILFLDGDIFSDEVKAFARELADKELGSRDGRRWKDVAFRIFKHFCLS